MKTHSFIGLLLITISGIYYDCNAQIECPVAYYYLNGDAIDSSWHHLDGILHGTTPTTDRLGNIDNALEFNGTSDYVLLPSLFDTQERAVDLWFLAENIGLSDQTIYVSDCHSLQYGRTLISVNSVGGTKVNFDAGGSQFSYPIIENQWYRATISVGVDSTKFYLNGLLVSAQVTGFMHSTDGLNQTVLGSNCNANANFFKGKIDQLLFVQCTFNPGQYSGIKLIESDSMFSISVFPNPATNYLTFDCPQKSTIEILNIQGQTILQHSLQQGKTDINISGLANGVYILKLNSSDETAVTKIVKE